MNKNTFFSLSRFSYLYRKDMIENWKKYVYTLIAIYGTLCVCLIFFGYQSYRWVRTETVIDRITSSEIPLLVFSFFAVGFMMASRIMEKLKNKTGRLAFLMVPATPFEKYLQRWTLYAVLFPCIFLVVFYLADLTRVGVCRLRFPDVSLIAPLDLGRFVADDQEWSLFTSTRQWWLLVSFFLFLQSIFGLGGSIWPKNSCVKTMASVFTIVLVFSLCWAGLYDLLLDGRSLVLPGIMSTLNENTAENTGSAVQLIFAAICWLLAYFRFKETDVNN